MEQMEFIRAEAALAAAEAAKAADPEIRQHWQNLAEAWRGLLLKGAGPRTPSSVAENHRC
jgi:hypothetical protein